MQPELTFDESTVFCVFGVFYKDFLLFCRYGRQARAADARAGAGRAGEGAVSIDRAAAHRFRVPLTHGLRFCHFTLHSCGTEPTPLMALC